MKEIDINTYVMCSDPSPELTIEDAKKVFTEEMTEAEIATLYAMVHNKAWWIEDEIYDFKKGTEEYTAMEEKIEQWFKAEENLKAYILCILKEQGANIVEKEQMAILEPFMKRNGFIYGNGWWIKE